MGDFEEIMIETEVSEKPKRGRAKKEKIEPISLEELSLHGKPVSLKDMGFISEPGNVSTFNHKDGNYRLVLNDGWNLYELVGNDTVRVNTFATLMAVNAYLNPPVPEFKKLTKIAKVITKKGKRK